MTRRCLTFGLREQRRRGKGQGVRGQPKGVAASPRAQRPEIPNRGGPRRRAASKSEPRPPCEQRRTLCEWCSRVQQYRWA
eukprot:5553034-Prymnesium_polylepis.1